MHFLKLGSEASFVSVYFESCIYIRKKCLTFQGRRSEHAQCDTCDVVRIPTIDMYLKQMDVTVHEICRKQTNKYWGIKCAVKTDTISFSCLVFAAEKEDLYTYIIHKKIM